ncbi:putative monovalent cation/H+ antiporter subunit A [Rhizobium sp. KVB221]|uniref:Monovalent cation/H+ antiporter subunit A n=1 Tax=Rhizobium setariae TaxID=2801340 RepID=A0A937CMJ1_9HYPH|nr:putative monovalent cation/H+ antiporter subunit A [Rhizobium setariae]MBL0370989.1 putative monovalent cation/H+ antiporter subunit A [Rhizobium setariae]
MPLAGAAIAPLLVRRLGHNAAWPLALTMLVPFLIFASHLPPIASGQAVSGGFAWAPSLGVNFSWRLDGLSLTFALLISGIGTLIVLYSGGYLKGHPHLGRFFSFILMFSAAMLGVVVSDNLLMLFVYWELTSITSFLLIGFDHARVASRRAALQALLVTGGGGLFLLAGLLMLGQMAGVTDIGGLIAGGAGLRQHWLIEVALLLVLMGAFTKSAQFPFHFWLPNAMEAPTPVSAFLHSATMVKAGVYLLMRLYPVFSELPMWQVLLPVFGATTLLVGALLAVRQTDLKLILAYTTVASLGLLVMLTGIGSERAVQAAVLYLVAHALFKGGLFMIAGVIDHEAGTRDITRLGGLCRAMPLTFAAALLAACSMGGVPLLAGFMAKEEIYEALIGGGWSTLLLVVAIAGNALMFAAGFAIALKPFLGARVETPNHAHDGPVLLMAGPVLLAVLGLAAGLGASALHLYFSSPMASAIAGSRITVAISAIPHLSTAFALSMLTILIGVFLLLALGRVRASVDAGVRAIGWGPDRGFDQAVAGLIRLSFRIGRFLQPGRLEIYLTITFAIIALCLLYPMVLFGELPAWPRGSAPLEFHEAAFISLAAIGLFAVLASKSRLTAIVSLGIQGFAVAVLYLLFGAPDLAFTQFMVETLSVIILALIMTRLRVEITDRRSVPQILMDGTIAVACGVGFTLFLLRAVEVPFNGELSTFFGQHSKLLAHGANVVNVIIVDFRGTDTLGEIAVVLITGLAILALVRLRAAKPTASFNDPDSEEGARS